MRIHDFVKFLLAAMLFALGACTTDSLKIRAEAGKVLDDSGKVGARSLQLLQENCASCHKLVSGAEGPVIAPSMGEIRQAYMAAFPEGDDFKRAIIAFNKNPSKEAALMDSAVVSYGLMPKLGVPMADVEMIADYLHSHAVGTDAWQRSIESNNVAVDSGEDMDHVSRGRKYAMGTKQALGSKLLHAVNTLGPAGAVDFCNLRASVITDSMALKYGASIKRVSDKPRNLANHADAEELAFIEALKSAKVRGEELAPLISEKGGKVLAYFAIETNEMCLKCHGRKGADIGIDTWNAIAVRYPDDKAIGYGPNEIRGIFVVEMTE
jgi:cytochrome c553